MSAIVFGSLNMDLVTRTPRLPKAGETLMGTSFCTTPGGKGANQSVALARLGVPTQMVGRVGGDAFGQELLTQVRSAGVQTDAVQVDPSIHSGVAIITVADNGDNQIIGVLGANGKLDASDVARMQTVLQTTSQTTQTGLQTGSETRVPTPLVLLQLEAPLEIVRSVAELAHQSGARVILDPAPVPSGSIVHLFPFVEILVPNEIEASQLVGFPVQDQASAAAAAIALQQQGASTVIVKLGGQGVLCQTAQEAFFVPAFEVVAVDTVAAGDAFAGGLAAALVEGRSLREAVVWGAAAGALAVTQVGAQTAMPDRATFEAFLRARGRWQDLV